MQEKRRTYSNSTTSKKTDVMIIGAGPLGIELAVLLKRAGVSYIQLEAKQIGNTIFKWPKHTHFYSSPERVALAGVPIHTPYQQSITGDLYLAYLRGLVESMRLEIRTYEPVTNVDRLPTGKFLVESTKHEHKHYYECQQIVFAMGNMNKPRRLGIFGEDLPFVHHNLYDPHLYFKTNLLVVGGKNSALESALRCWRAGAKVTLSYRRSEFDRSIVKPALMHEIDLLIRKKQIRFLEETNLERIDKGWVGLTKNGKRVRVPTDFVLICIGYEADSSLYQKLGIKIDENNQQPLFNPNTMETNMPNTYVLGTTAGGNEREHELFISTCHEHAEKIYAAITGNPRPSSAFTGSIPNRSYPIRFEEIKQS